MSSNESMDINDELYYHGFMSRAEAETMFKNFGDFLVRRIHENKTNVKRFYSNLKFFFQIYVLSVNCSNQIYHRKIKETQNKNYFYLNKVYKPVNVFRMINLF